MEMTKYKLGDLCRIASSKRIFESEYVEKGVPFIRGQEISDGSILDPKASFECYISQSRYEEIKEKYGKPTKGDILITAVGTIGNLCYLDKDIDFYFKDGNVIWFSEIISSCEGKFLFHFMKSSFFKDQLKYFMIGAVQKALTIDMLKKVEVPLPPLSEQKKIASVLSSLDDKIALNKKMNQKLEAMAKRLYDYWFVQYDFPDKNGRPYKTTGGPMTYNPTLKREIPEGWEVKTIGDYLKIGNGRDHSKLADGPYPVYGSGGLMRYVAEYLHDGETVLFPRKGTLNNVMYRNEPLWTVDTMFYTSVLVPHSALFVFYSAKMFDFERLNTGTGVPSMTSDIIKKLPIISPDRQTLEQFDKTVAKLYNQIHHNEKEISRLSEQRDKLLPLLMNGQVEVE